MAFRSQRWRERCSISPLSLIAADPNRRGTKQLRRLLASPSSDVTRSEFEEEFLRFLDSASLPAPEVNVPLQVGTEWIEADCVWRGRRVIVELDGRRTHGTRSAFERDRRRDRALQVEGWR